MKRTLEEQRDEYSQRRFLAMPLAGTIAWSVVGLAGVFLSTENAAWVLFIATGCIVYLGLFISRFTGENFLDKSKEKNTFDGLFLYTVMMALLVYSIAIPFFLVDPSSLPLTVGVLTGLMWLPLSWVIQHWVGIFHAVSRTLLVVLAWYLAPEHRFTLIPLIIVLVYVVTIFIFQVRRNNQLSLGSVRSSLDNQATSP